MHVRERKYVTRTSFPHHSNVAADPRRAMNSSASIMRGSRLFRGGLFTDLALLVIFLILVYVFVSRRNRASDGVATSIDSAGRPFGSPKKAFTGSKPIAGEDYSGSAQHLIDARVKKIPDFRSAECKGRLYNIPTEVSIVTTFFDYSFHDLKATIGSVLQNTPNHLIQEIIIVDDASTLSYIVDKSQTFAKSISKARLLRNEKQLWNSGSRMRGFREAQANIVVFLDTNTVVSPGWLEPLIHQIQRDPSAIAVPHFDSINDPVSYEYRATKHSIAASVSWSLAVRMSAHSSAPASDDKTVSSFSSPALRGNAMAVSKQLFEQIGGYDEGFQDGGGMDLELAIRAWLCGMKILVCRCSRVGVINLQDPVKVTTPINIRRITSLWFGGRSTLVFRNTAVQGEMVEEEKASVATRRTEIDALNLQCQDIDWYFHHVVDNLLTPSEKAVQFGLLKCRTGSCGLVAADKRIELGKCQTDDQNGPLVARVFEFTEDGLLVNDGKCITVKSTAYIVLEDCRADDNTQRWQYKDGQLINDWSHYCMMHVTDPDTKTTDGKRQIAMAQDCKSANEPQFMTFDFIAL